ncbi:hypothetical protein ABNF97_27250 [Plantactinospora sp. B6F1]|uniref:hypothetical protein n=1 Tax=Plantactinospora sp. B6F1 TaxID=3158971 RepID=UPI0032D8EA14
MNVRRLWRRLRIDTVLRPLVGSTRREVDVERVLFALVANRALTPSSKLAGADWVCQDVHLPGLAHVTDDACYRAMDQLIEVEPALTRGVYDQTADLLNLQVDLLFFDTTSTYFDLDEADDLVWRDDKGKPVDADDPAAAKQAGFRAHGKSRDSPATTCPRWWSGWPLPAPASPCACGAGPATPATPP